MLMEDYLKKLKEVEALIINQIEDELANALNDLVLKIVIDLLENNDPIIKGLIFYGRSPSVSEDINSYLGVDYLLDAATATDVPASPLYQNVTAGYSIGDETFYRVPILDYDSQTYRAFIFPLIDGKTVRYNIVEQWLDTPNTTGEEGERVFLKYELEDLNNYLNNRLKVDNLPKQDPLVNNNLESNIQKSTEVEVNKDLNLNTNKDSKEASNINNELKEEDTEIKKSSKRIKNKDKDKVLSGENG